MLIKSASNIFELLAISSTDWRFPQWLECFKLIFGTTTDVIMSDFNELLTLVKITTGTVKYRTFGDLEVSQHANWLTISPKRIHFYIFVWYVLFQKLMK